MSSTTRSAGFGHDLHLHGSVFHSHGRAADRHDEHTMTKLYAIPKRTALDWTAVGVLMAAACAIFLAEGYLRRHLDTAALGDSLMNCPTPGRFDVLRSDPLVLIDACHNPQSCESFVSSLDELDPDVDRRPTLLIAALADKDVRGITEVLVPAFPRFVLTQTSSDRALGVGELREKVSIALEEQGRDAECIVGSFDTVEQAVSHFTQAGEAFVAAGTITLAGEVAGLLRG